MKMGIGRALSSHPELSPGPFRKRMRLSAFTSVLTARRETGDIVLCVACTWHVWGTEMLKHAHTNMLKGMGAEMQKGTGPSSKCNRPLHQCTLSTDTQNWNCSIITLPRETQFVRSCFQFKMLRKTLEWGLGSFQSSPLLPLLSRANNAKGARDHEKAAQAASQFDGYLPFTEHLHGVAQIPFCRETEASESAHKKQRRQSKRTESLRDGTGNLALAVEQSGSHHGSLQRVDLGKAPTRP